MGKSTISQLSIRGGIEPAVGIVSGAKNKAVALVSRQLDGASRYDLWVVAMSNDSLLVGNHPLALELALHIRISQRPFRVLATIKLPITELLCFPVMIRHDSLPLIDGTAIPNLSYIRWQSRWEEDTLAQELVNVETP